MRVSTCSFQSFSLLGSIALAWSVVACGEGTLDPAMPDRPTPPAPSEVDEMEPPPEPATETPLPQLPPLEERPAGAVERPAYVDSTGFFVLDGRLYDALNNEFIFRGVNNAHIWFDTFDRLLAFDALENIADYGYNSVRIVWETSREFEGADPALLRSVIRRVIDLGMIPMVELHDVTGDETTEGLMAMAEYYARDDVKEVLLEFEPFLLINIANEWSGTDNFATAYTLAIELLRDSGLNHTLVIDANGFGQNAPSVLDNGQALLDVDPQHNLLFSVHMYGTYAGATGPALITSVLETAVDNQLPLIIGEFGWQAGNRNLRAIDVPHILAECTRLGLGYIPWSWKGNGGTVTYLDMAVDWAGQTLTDSWGAVLVTDENGIEATAQRASVYLLSE